MITGFTNILKTIKAIMQAVILSFMMLFFSAGPMLQYFKYQAVEIIETVEGTETSESSSDKKESKEKELDKFFDQFPHTSIMFKRYDLPARKQELNFFTDHFTNNSTPPPEVA